MRNFKCLLLTAAMFVISLGALAQTKMTIELKNGTNISYNVSEISKVSWTNGPGTPTGGDNDPDVQTVIGKPVDLGLSVKWADMNVGADSPEGYGFYYAWGETEPKAEYNFGTYKWFNDSFNAMTKYITDSYYGTLDNKTTLDPEDDAAHVNWGGDWRMPTDAEFEELRGMCTLTWSTLGGVNGYVLTGPNGNSIFLPAAGNRHDSSLYDVGRWGSYWSSSLNLSDSSDAYGLGFASSGVGWFNGSRLRGCSVRPVCP